MWHKRALSLSAAGHGVWANTGQKLHEGDRDGASSFTHTEDEESVKLGTDFLCFTYLSICT